MAKQISVFRNELLGLFNKKIAKYLLITLLNKCKAKHTYSRAKNHIGIATHLRILMTSL